MSKQPTFFDAERTTLGDAIELTAQSLCVHAADYDHWAIVFSGGKIAPQPWPPFAG